MLNVKSIKVTNGRGENKVNFPHQVSPKGGHDTFCELEASRVARDTVWELEGSTCYSLGTGGVYRVRDPARELEGARDAGNSL